jgi:hypothetical protein
MAADGGELDFLAGGAAIASWRVNLPAADGCSILLALLCLRPVRAATVFAPMPMPLHFHKLASPLIASTLLALAVGCQTPPFSPLPQHELESDSHRTAPPALENASAAADAATEADVMKQVQQISAKDPTAGKMLLDELSRAEPKLWPLVVQQFRSRQAYHEQLLAKPKHRTEPIEHKTRDVVANESPSEEIGNLEDPRDIRPDPALEQAFARATPANMPAPVDATPAETELIARATPAKFAEEAATPIAAQHEIVQAVVPASGEAGGRVEQAIYSVEAAAAPPAATDAKLDWQQHLRLSIADLNERMVDGPRSTAEVHQLVSLRMMSLLVGDTEAALKPIPNISTEEQDFWSGQIFALATFLDHHRQPDDQRRAAASVVHLDEAVGHLRELGSLSLRNMAFCKSVFGYGAYEPIENPIFTPGQQVTLYLEVENFHSESTVKGYATKLGASYELADDDGKRLSGGEFPNVEDCCQSRRRDFHIQYGLVLPKTAKPGKYHLTLAMNDRQSDKRGSASIAFEIR